MKYDDASWHSGGNYPPESPDEYSGTHIALFMKWCFTKGWAGKLHLEAEPDEVQKVIDGRLSATDFFFKYCDGKLTNEDFNDTGNEFAEKYYGSDGLYLNDYDKLFKDLTYVAPESAHDFDRLATLLESRYIDGVFTNAQLRARKPWWRIWSRRT